MDVQRWWGDVSRRLPQCRTQQCPARAEMQKKSKEHAKEHTKNKQPNCKFGSSNIQSTDLNFHKMAAVLLFLCKLLQDLDLSVTSPCPLLLAELFGSLQALTLHQGKVLNRIAAQRIHRVTVPYGSSGSRFGHLRSFLAYWLAQTRHTHLRDETVFETVRNGHVRKQNKFTDFSRKTWKRHTSAFSISGMNPENQSVAVCCKRHLFWLEQCQFVPFHFEFGTSSWGRGTKLQSMECSAESRSRPCTSARATINIGR